MKNFKLLLATAVLFAVGSAFTAANTNTVAGEYILRGDTWEPIGNGDCETGSGTCDYLKTGSATTLQYPDQYKNPANFTANRPGVYVE